MAAIETTYEAALGATQDTRRHLLLGNGFSVGLEPKLSYPKLYGEAIREDPSLAFLFNRLGVLNGDFETAIGLASNESDRQHIREGLLSAIRRVHPSTRPPQLGACGAFLSEFAGLQRPLRGKIFTTNYDLLVYRAIVACRAQLECEDGFSYDDGVWNPVSMRQVGIYYWHGALHLFSRPIPPLAGSDKPPTPRYTKLHATDRQSLIPLIAERLKQGDFPMFVAEGSPDDKKAAIKRNAYMKGVSRWFGRACAEPDSVLFTVGHSLAPIDQHIADRIRACKAEAVYIGCFKPEDWERADQLADEWDAYRESARLSPMPVYAFDSGDCHIWDRLQAEATA